MSASQELHNRTIIFYLRRLEEKGECITNMTYDTQFQVRFIKEICSGVMATVFNVQLLYNRKGGLADDTVLSLRSVKKYESVALREKGVD